MGQPQYLSFIKQLRSLNHELDERLMSGLRPIGLSCVQADALMALEGLQPCSLKTLSEHLIAESGHPSRLIARMRERGLVTVEASADDRRAMLISLTREGTKMAKESFLIREGIMANLHLSADDLSNTTDFLMSVRRQLTS
ncbi:MarR family winged helix-turn-helix transcriptional regulator [Bifidobacterium crudilactis]|jgi:MarR family transcriptional regulator, organic hydroperoxide resistance regulator|uniref:MarR family winged helix-turn-helix transcriptional regulator n=1 Tax=Bifidobacterium crudilactis TaxID=327277 RepID=UPI002F3518E0